MKYPKKKFLMKGCIDVAVWKTSLWKYNINLLAIRIFWHFLVSVRHNCSFYSCIPLFVKTNHRNASLILKNDLQIFFNKLISISFLLLQVAFKISSKLNQRIPQLLQILWDIYLQILLNFYISGKTTNLAQNTCCRIGCVELLCTAFPHLYKLACGICLFFWFQRSCFFFFLIKYVAK